MMVKESLAVESAAPAAAASERSESSRASGGGAPRAVKNADYMRTITPLLILLTFFTPSSTSAEYTRVELKIFGMDCAICAHGVRVAVQKVEGVESVELSLEHAQADIRLRAGNAVALDRFRQIVKANGFEPKDATVTAVGTVRDSGGKLSFDISGVGTSLSVSPDKTSAATLKLLKSALDAKAAAVFEVSGVVTLGKDGKETIAVSSARQR